MLNGFPDPRTRNSREQLQPAPRITAPSLELFNRPASLVLSLALAPLNVVYTIFSRLVSLLARPFAFLPRLFGLAHPSTPYRRPLSPQGTTDRFLREFRSEHDPSGSLPLVNTSYARAFDTAKRDLRFLLVIPVSPEHDTTESFIRSILLSSSFKAFASDSSKDLIIWAGSVADPEPYQISNALNVTSFPFAALIAHTPSVSPTSMSVISRLDRAADFATPEIFLAKIETAMTQYGEGLSHARAQRAEHQASRDLREQQNSAYERSLATDRARVQAKRDAELEKQSIEKAELERARKEQKHLRQLLQWKRWRAHKLAPEPSDPKNAVRVSVRMLDGARLIRSFPGHMPMEEVYAFVECYEVLPDMDSEKTLGNCPEEPSDFSHEYHFRLVSPMPREAFDLHGTNADRSIRQRIGRSANLIAENLEDE